MSDKPVAMQSFRERLPRQELRPFLTCVWIQEVAPGSPPYRYQTIPNGSAELVWKLGSAPKVIGPQTSPQETMLPPGTTAVGLRFQPGVATRLGVPVAELVDLEADAETVCGRWVVDVAERLTEQRSLDAAADAVEASLLQARFSDTQSDPLAHELVSRLLIARNASVHALAKSLFISERQLRRRCEAATGMNPKALHRIFRFQRFLALANTNNLDGRIDLGRLAQKTGYADQAHLSRETVRLAGLPPAQLLNDWQHDCSGVHDHTASRSQFRLTAA
jgi:AraC-like DNA-binding protein